MTVSHDTTRILLELGKGDESAANRLVPLVYDELRGLAAHYMQQERRGAWPGRGWRRSAWGVQSD